MTKLFTSASRNFLQKFPMELCQLQKLRSLSINNNRIDEIPEEIGKLKELHSLVSKSYHFYYAHMSLSVLT